MQIKPRDENYFKKKKKKEQKKKGKSIKKAEQI